MRRNRRWAHVVAAAWTGVAGIATTAGCASDQAAACTASDSGSSDDSSDSGGSGGDDSGGLIQVNGTYTDTACPSVNPLSVGPDNDGLVSVDATFNGSVDDGGAFTLTWTATSGAFVDPHALDTTFQCIAPGRVTVTFIVSGGGCDQRSSSTIVCTTVVGSHA